MSVHGIPPIEDVITRHRGPNQPRRGERSRRLWWVCPFHEDGNPSLCVEPGSDRFHCFGCGADGDAIDFVRRLIPHLSFREAVAAAGGHRSHGKASYGRRPEATRAANSTPPAPRPEGWQEFARKLVIDAEAGLWTDRGRLARKYLRGRGLTERTIRAAHLGLWPGDSFFPGIFPGSKTFVPRGIVIPWFVGPDLELVNIRRPIDVPKYWAVKGSRRVGIYPSASAIRSGKPVVITEGEFDALLLAQELDGLASVVTLGTAGDRPSPQVLGALLGANPWYVGSDSDAAGEASSRSWLANSRRCRRIRPPVGKDWTEAHQAGVNLRVWWTSILGGSEASGTDQESAPGGPESVGPIGDIGSTVEPVGGCPTAAMSPEDDSSPPCDPPYTWRDEISGWSIPWREAWGRYTRQLEEREGLCWWSAEQRSLVMLNLLKARGTIDSNATTECILALLVDVEIGSDQPGYQEIRVAPSRSIA